MAKQGEIALRSLRRRLEELRDAAEELSQSANEETAERYNRVVEGLSLALGHMDKAIRAVERQTDSGD
jgi:hypothetical protein